MAVDVVGLGIPVMDLVVNLPFMPEKDGYVCANEIFYQGGGKIATGMVASARLGLKAGVLAKVGADFAGDFVIKDFIYNGVDTSRILRGAPGDTGVSCISLSEEETATRIIIGRKWTVKPLTPDEVDYEYIKSAKYLLVEKGGAASLAAVKFAKEQGVTVVLDGDEYYKETEQMLPWVDVFIGSEYYYKERFGTLGVRESCEEIRGIGVPVVWFTFGEQGCVGLVDGVLHEIPRFKVDVRDTTGAGDVFHGAYIAALAKNKTHTECARYASAAAAIKCTYIGGRTGIPTSEIVERFLKDGVIETKELDERLEYYRSSYGNT